MITIKDERTSNCLFTKLDYGDFFFNRNSKLLYQKIQEVTSKYSDVVYNTLCTETGGLCVTAGNVPVVHLNVTITIQ